jgi:hypothetical protein
MSANLGARDGHLGWCVALHKEFRLDIRLVLLPSFDILYILCWALIAIGLRLLKQSLDS